MANVPLEGHDSTSEYPTAMSESPSLVNQLIDFFSHASEVTIIATVGAAFAVLYLVAGRLGLLFIGLVCGVILHGWWEDRNDSRNDSHEQEGSRKRRELGIELAKRLIDWEEKRGAHEEETDGFPVPIADEELDVSDFGPATGPALGTFIDTVIKDYVSWWYEPILPSEPAFPLSCRQALSRFIYSASGHLSRKRPAEVFLQFTMNASSLIIVFLSELSVALGATATSSRPVADSVQEYLEKHPESALANILSAKEQRKKLNLVATDLLEAFLDSQAYNCGPVKIFLREIVSGVILEYAIQTCSAPDYINGWIIYLLEQEESGLMEAIDAGLDSLDKQPKDRLEGPHYRSQSDNGFYSEGKTAEFSQSTLHRVSPSASATTVAGLTQRAAPSGSPAKPFDGIKSHVGRADDSRSSEQAPQALTTGRSTSPILAHSGDRKNGPVTGLESSIAVEVPSTDGSSISKTDSCVSIESNNSLSNSVSQQRMDESRTSMPSKPRFYEAAVSILDDSVPGDETQLRNKPTDDYLLQIELKNSSHSGWMNTRKYSDFEVLHETLRRIAVISGAPVFAQRHPELPHWKGKTRHKLHQDFELYLRDALKFECLAECEGMKRFLEKHFGNESSTSASTKSGFSFPSPTVFENMGKGMLDVINAAPKTAASGKAMFGGVSGIFGTSPGGNKHVKSQASIDRRHTTNNVSSDSARSFDSQRDSNDWNWNGEGQTDSQGFQPIRSTESPEPRPSLSKTETSISSPEARVPAPMLTPSSEQDLTTFFSQEPSVRSKDVDDGSDGVQLEKSTATSNGLDAPTYDGSDYPPIVEAADEVPKKDSKLALTEHAPLSEEEAIMAVELLFAVVNEVYGLSSAWKLRKRLLNAAKSFLLRPGNPNLGAIRKLMQQSIIDDNTTDEALAGYINSLRESCFGPVDGSGPPEWTPLSEEEREKQRVKARNLFITKGMPPALVGFMGSNATGEAMGRIFDSLQIESVARGFVFSIMLQAVKVVIQ